MGESTMLGERPREMTASGGLNTEREILRRAGEIIDIEANALERLKSRLDGSLLKAVQLLESSQGRVIVTGMGKSGIIGRKIAATFSSTGTPAYFLHPAEGSHGDLGVIMKNDVVIAISNSGETPEILGILPTVKLFELPLIAMTGNPNSTLAQRSDVVLDISVPQEACPLGLAPTASTTATLVMGDVLAVLLLERKGFTHEDFALFHPAGSLGKRLLMKVSDLMHAGADLPVVTLDTPFLEALMEMTSKKLGMTLILDQAGDLLGLLTDGDVRRALSQYPDARNIPLEKVMTPSPRTIEAEALLVTALNRMEERKITTLVVASKDSGKPVGVIHLHDILKAGIS